MSATNLTITAPAGKPNKPYPEFPLFAHATGRWAKKIRGRFHYFGPWNDPNGALQKYLDEKEALHAGRKPREESAGATLKNLGDQFLSAKKALVASGELTQRSWDDYKAAFDHVVAKFGRSRLITDLDPEDFAQLKNRFVAKKWGPVTIGNMIQRIRVAFRFAFENGLIDRPMRYGQAFKRPSRKVVRLNRAKKGPKLFTADEIRRLIAAASPAMKAMFLLGINGGFGNADCGNLPFSALDLDGAVIDFPRPKTGIARRVPLWPETAEALRDSIERRPKPKKKENARLVFITSHGYAWAKDTPDSPVAKETKKLMKALGINRRKGLGFYTLRHTFRTVADETKDQPAVDFIMGHEVPHMSSVYRETISDERLRAVVDHVHKWLYTLPLSQPGENGARAVIPMNANAAASAG